MSTSVPEQFKKGYKPVLESQQATPGHEHLMKSAPVYDTLASGKKYKGSEKLEGKIALITGADSGIGRATAILFAIESAEGLFLSYHPSETKDAEETKKLIEERSKSKVVLFEKDLIGGESACQEVVDACIKEFGRIDTLSLHQAHQNEVPSILDLPAKQWMEVFEVNIHAMFHLTKAAIPHMPRGSTITFNASINPFVGHPKLLDYTSTKGAIIGFMRALSNQIVAEKGIRVNAVGPGPILTPLIVATMSKESLETFGETQPMERCGQPIECATCFVFLASDDSSYISGNVLHPNGGVVIA